MTKKCIYCKTQIDDDSVVDVCRRCGIGVWGERMFNAIIQNMENARTDGDLHQGLVTFSENKKQSPRKEMSFVTEAKQTLEKQKQAEIPETALPPSAQIPDANTLITES